MTHSTSATARARLRATRSRYPDWRIFASSSGHIYAAGWNDRNAAQRAQVTLHADSTAGIGRVIRQWQAGTDKALRRAA